MFKKIFSKKTNKPSEPNEKMYCGECTEADIINLLILINTNYVNNLLYELLNFYIINYKMYIHNEYEVKIRYFMNYYKYYFNYKYDKIDKTQEIINLTFFKNINKEFMILLYINKNKGITDLLYRTIYYNRLIDKILIVINGQCSKIYFDDIYLNTDKEKKEYIDFYIEYEFKEYKNNDKIIKISINTIHLLICDISERIETAYLKKNTIEIYEYKKFDRIDNINELIINIIQNHIDNFALNFQKSFSLINFSNIELCNSININIANIHTLFDNIYYLNNLNDIREDIRNDILKNLLKYIYILKIIYKLLYYNDNDISNECLIELIEYERLFLSIYNYISNPSNPSNTEYLLKNKKIRLNKSELFQYLNNYNITINKYLNDKQIILLKTDLCKKFK